MDNESTSNSYLAVNHDGISELTSTHQSPYEHFTDIIRDNSQMRSASNWDEGHTPDHPIQYFDADFDACHLFPNLPQSTDEPLSDDEWSQRLAPVASHIQNCEDYGNMRFASPVDVIGTTAFNTADIDQPQSSAASSSSHPVYCPEAQAAPVQSPEPPSNGTSAPSSTPATSSQSYSPVPETAGQAFNTTGVDGKRYTCNYCHVSPKTKRDWDRHLETNKHKARGNLSNSSSDNGIPGAAASTGFHCPVEGCKYHSSTGRTITREDNLRRHVKIVHGIDMGRKSEE